VLAMLLLLLRLAVLLLNEPDATLAAAAALEV
jgi:hypothetical protein